MQKKYFYLSEAEIKKIDSLLGKRVDKDLQFIDELFLGQNLLCKIETIQYLFNEFLILRDFNRINTLLKKVLLLFNENFEDNALIINVVLQLFKNISNLKIDYLDYDIIYNLEARLKEHNDRISIGYFYKILGDMHFEKEDYKLSIYYYEESLTYLTEHKWINLEELHHKIGISSIITERYSEAYSHFYTALYEYKQKNNASKILEIYFWLSYLFISIHEVKNADDILSGDFEGYNSDLNSIVILLRSYYYLKIRDFKTFNSIFDSKLLEGKSEITNSLNLLRSLIAAKITSSTLKGVKK